MRRNEIFADDVGFDWSTIEDHAVYVRCLRRWMRNQANCGNCEHCPENRGFEPGADNKLPCGQYRCWVPLYKEGE